MNWHAWATLLVVTVTVVMLARDWMAPAISILGSAIVLLVIGVITPAQAFAGFSNPAPITVAALFIIAAGVEKTGVLQPLVKAMLGNGEGTRMARLLVPVAGASAFLNNTPIVAMLAPQVADWAAKREQPASWYLMPLSFATILGGMLTLIGTSTNLVVSGLLHEHGMAPLGMFEITRVGLPVAALGLVLLVFLSRRVLPDRRAIRADFEANLREYVVHMTVSAAGPMAGQTVEEAGLRELQGVYLVEIERDGQVLAPVSPSTVLRGNDRLTFVGRVDLVRDLQAMRGLAHGELDERHGFDGAEHTFFEVVLSEASELTGKTLKEIGFRGRYQAAVLAIHRAGERVNAKLGEVRLQAGDVLLVVADADFGQRWRHRSDFLLVSHLGGRPPVSSRKGGVALARHGRRRAGRRCGTDADPPGRAPRGRGAGAYRRAESCRGTPRGGPEHVGVIAGPSASERRWSSPAWPRSWARRL